MNGAVGPGLGEYVETASPLHRAPAAVKMAVAVALLTGAALAGPPCLVALFLAAAGGVVLARMPWRMVGSLVRTLLWFGLLTLAAQLLLGGSGVLELPGSGEELAGRAWAAGRAWLRASVALTALTTLIMTTPPVEAAETLLRPWGRSGRRSPSGGLALAIVMAFRFCPLLMQEFRRMRRAREARGARFGLEGWRSTLRDWGELYPAFLVAALRRAEEVALALEARGFVA